MFMYEMYKVNKKTPKCTLVKILQFSLITNNKYPISLYKPFVIIYHHTFLYNDTQDLTKCCFPFSVCPFFIP